MGSSFWPSFCRSSLTSKSPSLVSVKKSLFFFNFYISVINVLFFLDFRQPKPHAFANVKNKRCHVRRTTSAIRQKCFRTFGIRNNIMVSSAISLRRRSTPIVLLARRCNFYFETCLKEIVIGIQRRDQNSS